MPYSALDKRRCAQRELALRRHVYPTRIAKGAMTLAESDRELAIMSEIVDDYRKLEVVDAPTLDLGQPTETKHDDDDKQGKTPAG